MRRRVAFCRVTTFLLGFIIFVSSHTPVHAQRVDPTDRLAFARQLHQDKMYLPAAEEFLSIAEATANEDQSQLARLWASRSYYAAGEWRQAVTTLEPLTSGLIEKSRACSAFLLLGKCLEKLGQPDRAFEAYATLVGRYPECPQHAEAAFRSGMIGLRREQPARAIVFFSKVGDSSPDSLRFRASLGRARALSRLGRGDEAAEIVKDLDRTIPDAVACEVHLERGRILFDLGRWEDAALALRNATTACADSVHQFDAWSSLSAALERNGRWNDAAAAQERAAEWVAGERAAGKLFQAGEMYAQAERWEDVIRVLTRAQSLAEVLPMESAMILADAHRREKRFSTAVRMYLSVEVSTPDPNAAAQARWEVAQTYIAAGWFRLAANALERFRLMSPDHVRAPEALRLAGEILSERLDRKAAAAGDFEILATDYPYSPEAPEVLLLAADCRLDLGMIDDARKAYRRILIEYPTSGAVFEAARESEALEAYFAVDWEGARDRLERVVAGGSAPSAVVLADVAFEQLKDYRAALPLYEAIAGSDAVADLKARAQYRVGVCHMRMAEDPREDGADRINPGALPKARQAFERVIAEYPGAPWAEEARWMLDRIQVQTYDGEEERRTLLQIQLLEAFAGDYAQGAHRVSVFYELGKAHERLAELGAADHYLTAAGFYGQVPEEGEIGGGALLAAARCWFGAGNFGEAASRYARLADVYRGRPLHPELLYRHAESLHRLEQTQGAARVWDELVGDFEGSPWSTRSALKLADLAVASGDCATGAAYYERVVARAVEPDVRERSELNLAECLGELGRRQEALARLDELIFMARGRPAADRASLAKGRILEKSGDLVGAAETYRSLIASSPSEDLEAQVWAHLGSVLFALGENGEAARALHSARSGNLPEPWKPDVFAKLSRALYRADRGVEGDSAFAGLRTVDSPDTLVARVALERGRYLIRTGNTEEGIRMFAQVMENFPADDLGYTARYEIALCHLKMREFDEARSLLQTIVEGTPGPGILAGVWFKLGTTHYMEGEYGRASDSYERVLEIDPRGPMASQAYFNLGLALEKQRRWADAAEMFRTLMARFPEVKDRDRVAFKYGYALQEAGRHEEAVAAYEAVLPSASPEVGAEAQFWMGECLERARQSDKAILAFLKIRYLYPDQTMWAATGQLKAAELYTRTGRADEARKLYRLVLEQNGPESQWGAIAGKELEALGPEKAPSPSPQ